jgi:predicted transcriptional regulator
MPNKCPHCNGSGMLESGKELRKLREKAKYPKRLQQYVAGEMGIAPSYLSDLENDRRDWNADLIKRFKEALK